MGKLAFWGGVAGAAKGWEAGIQAKAEQAKSEWDEARERRILDLKNQMEKESQQAAFGQQEKVVGMQIGSEEKIAGARTEAASALQTSEQDYKRREGETERDWKARQAELDRAAAERRANIAASAKSGAAGKPFTVTKMMDTRQGVGGIPEQYEKIVITDRSGTTYIQQGDRFVLQDPTGEFVPRAVKKANEAQKSRQGAGAAKLPSSARIRAPQSAVQDLLKDPTRADEFIQDFGYLPAAFLPVLIRQQQTQPGIDTGETTPGWEDLPALEPEPQSAAP